MARYMLRLATGPWREVAKEEWVAAERVAGFRNTMDQPHEPGTAGFGVNGMAGRIEYDDPQEELHRTVDD